MIPGDGQRSAVIGGLFGRLLGSPSQLSAIKNNDHHSARSQFKPLWWEATIVLALLSFLFAVILKLLR